MMTDIIAILAMRSLLEKERNFFTLLFIIFWF